MNADNRSAGEGAIGIGNEGARAVTATPEKKPGALKKTALAIRRRLATIATTVGRHKRAVGLTIAIGATGGEAIVNTATGTHLEPANTITSTIRAVGDEFNKTGTQNEKTKADALKTAEDTVANQLHPTKFSKDGEISLTIKELADKAITDKTLVNRAMGSYDFDQLKPEDIAKMGDKLDKPINPNSVVTVSQPYRLNIKGLEYDLIGAFEKPDGTKGTIIISHDFAQEHAVQKGTDTPLKDNHEEPLNTDLIGVVSVTTQAPTP